MRHGAERNFAQMERSEILHKWFLYKLSIPENTEPLFTCE